MSLSDRIIRLQKFRRLAGALTVGVFADRVAAKGEPFACLILGAFLVLLISDVIDMMGEDT